MAKAVYDLNTWKYVGWGTGTTTAAKAATQCENEGSETSTTKVTGTLTSNTVTTTNDQLQVVATITCAGAGKNIANAGLFRAASAGATDMMEYGTFTAIPLSVNDSIQFTFLLQVT